MNKIGTVDYSWKFACSEPIRIPFLAVDSRIFANIR